MVPFFGGTKTHLKRHIEFVEELGFEVHFVPLPLPKRLLSLESISFARKWVGTRRGLGLRYSWAKEIHKALDRIPGKKIVYSFSAPTASAIHAIAHRKQKDVVALIADSGPPYHSVLPFWNYFTHQLPVNKLARGPAAVAALALWGGEHAAMLDRDLAKLPKDFPILSIRGWKDPLVSPSMINRVFSSHQQLHTEILALPEGAHLNGLKDFPETYCPRVEGFLKNQRA